MSRPALQEPHGRQQRWRRSALAPAKPGGLFKPDMQFFPHPAFLFSSHQCYREDSRHSQSDQSQVVIDESIPCHPIRWTNGALAPTFQMLDQPLTQKRVRPLKPHPVMETTKIGAPSFHLPVDPGHQLRYRHIRRLGVDQLPKSRSFSGTSLRARFNAEVLLRFIVQARFIAKGVAQEIKAFPSRLRLRMLVLSRLIVKPSHLSTISSINEQALAR